MKTPPFFRGVFAGMMLTVSTLLVTNGAIWAFYKEQVLHPLITLMLGIALVPLLIWSYFFDR